MFLKSLGNPHIHPSSIVAKIRERFQINDDKRYLTDIIDNRPSSAPPTQGPMTWHIRIKVKLALFLVILERK